MKTKKIKQPLALVSTPNGESTHLYDAWMAGEAKAGRPKSALVALRKRFLAYRKAKGLK